MFSLEPTDALANPAFKDVAACLRWLGQLQLTNLNLAQGTLRKQLDELNRCPLRGNDRLQILETLRETVTLVQTDIAKKLFGKKLPLSDDELTLLIGLTSLWQSLLNGYLRCLQTAEAGESQLAREQPLLCQRSMLYCSLQVEEYLHAGCEPAAEMWQQLHTIYAHIETLGLQTQTVQDDFSRPGLAISCRTLYARTLLMHRARLLGLSRHQWHVAEHWLNLWNEVLSIEPRCSMTLEDAPPLAIDLAGSHALQSIQHAQAKTSMRYLVTITLSKLIRVKTILLQHGQTPQQQELGNELSGKDCIELLNKLHACWCEAHADSLADTPRDSSSLFLCIGLEKIYAQIALKPFKPVKESSKADKIAQRQSETFGRVVDESGKHESLELGFAPEEWLIEDDGLLRGHLLRLHATGERLGAKQILSVFPPHTTQHKVAVIDFVRATQHGHLYIGVHYLPGQPQALVAHGISGHENLQSGSAAALMLPAVEKLHIPASLILPRDWFHAGRVLQLILPDNSKQSVSLGFSVLKGSDFERVSFKPVV